MENKLQPVGTVIEIEEVYGHTFKKRKSKRVQWMKEIDVGTKLYTHPANELTDEVKDALTDALSGWKYIRESHGDLYGVGWDRVQDKLEAILRKAQG